MNYILRIYGVSFLKISAFLISYSSYFVELVPTSSHYKFFFPVPCLYSLNKNLPQLTVLFVVISLKTLTILAEYLSPYSVITMPCFVGEWECQVKFSRLKGRIKQEKMLLPGWVILSYSILVPLPTIPLCSGGPPEKDAALVIQIITASSTLTPDASVLFLSLYLMLLFCRGF